MDRRRVALLAAAAIAAGGCGGGLAGATSGAGGGAVRHEADGRRGVLSYAVGFARAGERLLVVAVELDVAFSLAVREVVPAAASGEAARLDERGRLALGPHEWDVTDLAIAGGVAGVRPIAYVGSADGSVRAIDLLGPDAAHGSTAPGGPAGGGRPQLLARWRTGFPVTALAVSPDGGLLAVGGAGGELCLRRVADRALLQCFAAHTSRIAGLTFDPDGARLASASWDGRALVLRAPSLAPIAALDTGGSANAVAFAPAGDRLAVAVSGAPPAPGAGGRAIAARDPRARVLLWRPVRGGPAPRALTGHAGPVTALAWTGRDRLLSAAWDGTARMWDTRAERELGRVEGFTHMVRDLAAAPGGRWAAAAAWAAAGEGPATALLRLGAAP